MTRPLTDINALQRNRRRALRNPALFLHEHAISEIQDRLCLVNRNFTNIAVVSGFPEIWQAELSTAAVISDDETLNLQDGAYDLIIHAMCLHWANDPVGQMIQARRALKPDGLFLCVLLGGDTLNELRTALSQAESDLYGSLSARIVPMGEIRDLGALLQRAGFALPVADSVSLNATYQSPLHLMHDLRAMGEGNALASRSRRPIRRALLERVEEIYQSAFGTAQDRIPATFELIVLTGWAPDSSQPQPLRPGSASTRLAEALGAVETKLND